MTIEIRQMLIKSNVGTQADRSASKKSDKQANAKDEAAQDCGGCEGEQGGSEERRRMRIALAAEFERMRER